MTPALLIYALLLAAVVIVVSAGQREEVGKGGGRMPDIACCKWCGRPEAGNPGDYYHEKQCHRRDVLRRIEEAKRAGVHRDTALERELAEALYAGD